MRFSRSLRGYDPAGVHTEIDLRYMYHKREEEEKQAAVLRTQRERDELALRLESMKGRFEADHGIVLLTEKYQKYVKTNLVQKANQLAQQKIQKLNTDTDQLENDIFKQINNMDAKIDELKREIKSVIKVIGDILEFNDFGEIFNDSQLRQIDDAIAEFQLRADKEDSAVYTAEEGSSEWEMAKVALSNVNGRQEPVIILAENDPHSEEMIRQALDPEGFRVISARDESQLTRLIYESAPPDFLLLSMQLPETDVIQLIKKLRSREDWKTVPIIGLTDNFTEQEIVQILDSGAYDCLQKPFSPRELAARVKRFCLQPTLSEIN